MTTLHDIIIPQPLGDTVVRLLLLPAFFLHLFFVLLVIGSAIIGTAALFGRSHEPGLDARKRFFHPFFIFKSLAVSLGVGPLLLMQVGHTVPFITATNLLAPLWLMIIPILIFSFLLIEWLSERKGKLTLRQRVLAILATVTLLIVPGTFSAVVVTTENPDVWNRLYHYSQWFPPALAVHWLFRLMHVVAAAIIFTAALQYLFVQRDDADRRRRLRRWVISALVVQFVIGVALYSFLPRVPTIATRVLVIMGVALAAVVLYRFHRANPEDASSPRPARLAAIVVGLLIVMLSARQLLQDRVLVPLNDQLVARATIYEQSIRPFRPLAIADYHAQLHLSNESPATIYERSCSFCHGTVGNGGGDDAPLLTVPPEDLTALRIGRPHLRQILMTGVPGTAMPRFGFYTKGEIDRLIHFLRNSIGLTSRLQPPEIVTSLQGVRHAQRIYAQTCAACHGIDGTGSLVGRQLQPPTPDLTQLTLTGPRAFEIISSGYPGTAMQSYGQLPEETRWGLVEMVHEFYQQPYE